MKSISTLAFIIVAVGLNPTTDAASFNLKGALRGVTVVDPGVNVPGGVRGFIFKSMVIGDLVGEGVVVHNEQANASNSKMWGTFVLRVSRNGQVGGFSGSYTGVITDGILDYRLVGEGTGDFLGMKLIYKGGGPSLFVGDQPYVAKIVPKKN